MIGNCCYAYFQYCDPWKNGWIAERDQGIGSNVASYCLTQTKDGYRPTSRPRLAVTVRLDMI